MHNVLFVLIWPLAAICPFLPRSRFVAGFIMFLTCQLLLWYTTMRAMSSSSWNESAGDWLVPIIITLPVPVFVALIVVKLVFLTVSRLLLRCCASHREAGQRHQQ